MTAWSSTTGRCISYARLSLMLFLRVEALVYRRMAASGLLEREDGGAELGDVDGPDGRDVRRDRRVGPYRGREPARGVDGGEGRAQLGQMGPLDDGRVQGDDRVGPAERRETLTRAQNVDGAPKLGHVDRADHARELGQRRIREDTVESRRHRASLI